MQFRAIRFKNADHLFSIAILHQLHKRLDFPANLSKTPHNNNLNCTKNLTNFLAKIKKNMFKIISWNFNKQKYCM